MLSGTFVGIAPQDVWGFVLAQLLAACLVLVFCRQPKAVV